ncbi:MAG: DUF1822 family protein [Crinalium sp.]
MLFPEADIWDLDKLITKIESVRSRKLTDFQRQCLEGTLAGYSPADIAPILNTDARTVRNTLAEQINPYIKEILGFPPGLETMNWARAIILLDYEYKAPRGIGILQLGLNEIDLEQLEIILNKLRKIQNNSSVKIDKIQPGSILLFLESTQAGIERIRQLFLTGELSQLLDVPVLDVRLQPAILNLSQLLQNNLNEAIQAGWRTLEEIFGITTTTFAFRSIAVKRAKQIQLGELTLALILDIAPAQNQEISIYLGIYPLEPQNSLPENLKITLFFESGEPLEIPVTPNSLGIIQELFFDPGEQFSVQLSLEDESIIEYFII